MYNPFNRDRSLDERVLREAAFFIEHHEYVLDEACVFFGISRPMMNVDLTYKLPLINTRMAMQVRQRYVENFKRRGRH